MTTRYTVQYWYIDEHDTLDADFNRLNDALRFAHNLNKSKYKEITCYARHWHKVDNSFDYNGVRYKDWKWELVSDDYFKDIPLE